MHIHRRIREQESPRSYWPGTVGAAPCLIPIVYDMGERSLYREPLETLSENAVASIPKIDKVGRGTRTPALWQESVPVLSPWVKSCCLDIPFPVIFYPSRYVSTVKRLYSSVHKIHRRLSSYPSIFLSVYLLIYLLESLMQPRVIYHRGWTLVFNFSLLPWDILF